MSVDFMNIKKWLKKNKLPVVLLVFAAILIYPVASGFLAPLLQPAVEETIVTPTIREVEQGEIKTLPDGTKYLIHPSNLLSGGPPKGGIGVDRGIPAIVNPKFIPVSEADKILSDNDIIFGIAVEGEARAYPKDILVWHEIVNDNFGDKPVLVTYCPLCGTGIAFERTIDGEAVRFGTSGKLYNSNLVMYDEKTETYWTQVGGLAVLGPLTGMKLKQVPIDTVFYGDWKRIHPDTKVLSRDTGYIRPYGTDPYGDYYTSSFVGFGATFTDTRLHPKTMVAGIVIGETSKAYPVPEVAKVGLVNDVVAGREILVTFDPSITIAPEINPLQVYDRNFEGQILEFEIRDGKLFDKQTNTQWDFNTGEGLSGINAGNKLERIDRESDMWFSWLSFHPDTELFKA